MQAEYDGRQIVGIDLHRRRSVIVRMTETGEKLDTVRIDNDPVALGLEIAKAGPDPEVVLEATYGWYWAADVLTAAGARVHLAHPLGVKGFAYRRVKNDARDAADLADLLRMGRLPEAYVAPPAVRELRGAGAVSGQAGRLAQWPEGVGACGVGQTGRAHAVSDLFGVGGRELLARAPLDGAYRGRVASLCRLIEAVDFEIDAVAGPIRARLSRHRGYTAIQAIPGIGPVLGAVFVAEIGEVDRFPGPAQLTSWAGLTPRHRESDLVVHRGRITKQGSTLVRWAAVEAAHSVPHRAGWLVSRRAAIAERRGRNIATVAVARKLLTLVYYGLRDGRIRALAPAKAAA